MKTPEIIIGNKYYRVSDLSNYCQDDSIFCQKQMWEHVNEDIAEALASRQSPEGKGEVVDCPDCGGCGTDCNSAEYEKPCRGLCKGSGKLYRVPPSAPAQEIKPKYFLCHHASTCSVCKMANQRVSEEIERLQTISQEDYLLALERVAEASKEYCTTREYQNVTSCREDQDRLEKILLGALDALTKIKKRGGV